MNNQKGKTHNFFIEYSFLILFFSIIAGLRGYVNLTHLQNPNGYVLPDDVLLLRVIVSFGLAIIGLGIYMYTILVLKKKK